MRLFSWPCLVSLMALVVPGCSLLFEPSTDAPEELQDWSYRSSISFKNVVVGESLVDFPLLVRLEARDAFGAEGADLRFVDGDQQILAHEIEVGGDGALYAWVKLRELSTETEPLTLYYGSSTALDPDESQEVWDPGFVAVYHLDSLASGDVFDYSDSSGHGNNARGIQGAESFPTRVEGYIGSGQELSQDSHINAGNPRDLDLVGDEITMELWAYYPALPDDVLDPESFGLIAKGGYFDGYRYMMGPKGKLVFQMTGVDLDGAASSGDGAAPAGQWHYLVARYSGEKLEVFVDGMRAGEQDRSGPIDSSGASLLIGRGQVDRYAFAGILDEARLSTVARSDAWIAMQHLSMRGELVEVGPEEAR